MHRYSTHKWKAYANISLVFDLSDKIIERNAKFSFKNFRKNEPAKYKFMQVKIQWAACVSWVENHAKKWTDTILESILKIQDNGNTV